MRKHIIYYCFLISTLLLGSALNAQTITGTVSDNNGAIPGVNIIIKGTLIGTTTDFDGNYNIEITNSNAILVFSMMGYTTQEISVNGQSQINVLLSEDLQALDEIVLVGYSLRKKSTLTGAVSVVNVEGLNKARTQNVAQALQGQVAGVQIASSSGAPGGAIQVRIRGVGTIGNNNPLYVVDGVPSRDISFLNQADIKTMTVLKDAAAAAIYGARGSAGVVLITTKSGSKGKMTLDLNYYYGIQNATNLPNMLNAEQYINTAEKAWNNTFTGSNPYTADRGRADFGDTDWLDELFVPGHSQNLQLSASGGSDKLQYLMSLGYYDEDGIVVFDNDKFQRINFRTNINANISDRLKVGTNLQLSYSTQDKVPSTGESLIRFALLRAPVIPVYKDVNDPTYSQRDPFTDMPFFTPTGYDQGLNRTMYEMVGNPIAMAHFSDNQSRVYKTFGNVFGQYAFLKDKALTFRTNIGIDLSFFHDKRFNENFGDDDGGGSSIDQGLGRQNRPNSLSESRGEAFTFTFSNTLNYVKTFNEKHAVSAMFGTEYVTNYESSIGASRARFPYTTDEFRYLDQGGTDLDVWNSGSASEWNLFSYFGSASYVFDNKYMITANLRADASSRFSESNRWGYFPSVSAGWKLSDEDFLNDVDWLSNLKLRASWGQVGNQNIDNYAYLELLRQGDIVELVRYGNADLKWETTTQTNIGFDVGLLNNKVAISAEYFQKNTTDILLPVGLPGFLGDLEPTIINAGEVSNKGFEFSVDYRNSDNAFKYNINANLSTLTNNVEKLHPNLPNITADKYRTVVGQALDSYYGYKMIGIYQNQAEIDSHLSGTVNPSTKPGDIKFKDINGDGIISADNDREFIGSSIPDLTYGISFSADYKGFDFSMLFQGVEGVDKYNDGKKIVDFDTRPFNYTTAILGSWDGEGSTNSIPRVAFEDNGSSNVSSLFVEDASYFRLRNIEIGYTLKGMKGFQDMRLYISGKNLFTSTNYTGLDPEVSGLVDKGTYPLSTAFLFGVNVKF
ncbi:SusC/RagA family TonB-linked outer membrane protein [Flavivirga spongiicola]|uniref:TonB-dependent receptor n=1 Tax=Flavivirga spongiicola TaxID=421621 RepID=A0ABU7XUJ3_9FLAO|nr:TonB-dependent receptor [Flavivirga sp. MEBiC05379]MDO5979099.1 TonB-dependent receptor [Flavivirga sp. MEBiC05379]